MQFNEALNVPVQFDQVPENAGRNPGKWFWSDEDGECYGYYSTEEGAIEAYLKTQFN